MNVNRTRRIRLAASLLLFPLATPAVFAQAVPTTASLLSVATIAPAIDNDPQKDDLLEGFDRIGARAKDKNEINVDKNMMAMAGKQKERYADLDGKIDFISVRNYVFAEKGQYQMSDLDVLRRKLDGNGWNHMVHNESQGTINDVVVKSLPDGYLSDMVVLNVDAKDVNFVHIQGHFHLGDVRDGMKNMRDGMKSAPTPPSR